MTKHHFSIPVRNATLSVVASQCTECGLIVPYSDGKLPDDVMSEKCGGKKIPGKPLTVADTNKQHSI